MPVSYYKAILLNLKLCIQGFDPSGSTYAKVGPFFI